MNAIKEISEINLVEWILIFFSLMFAIKEIIEIFSYFKNKFHIKTFVDENKENEEKKVHEIEERIVVLEKHDNWQYKEITKMSKGIENIESELLDNNLERKRKYILDFCSSLSNGQKQNREAFNNVFKTYKNYEKLLSDHKMENGQAEESIKFISEKYQECLRNGNF